MRKNLAFLLLFVLALFSGSVLAVSASSTANLINANLLSSTQAIFRQIQTIAMQLLSMLVLVQFTITHIGTLKSDWDAMWAKFLGSLTWFTFCFYVMDKGPDFITGVTNQFKKLAGNIATNNIANSGGGVGFDAGLVMGQGLDVANELFVAFNSIGGNTSTVDKLFDFVSHPVNSFLPTILMAFIWVIILACTALIALKIFMINIEIIIVVAISPLSFAFLGLDALRDQGIAPFKYMIAVIYRILILAAILSAMSTVSTNTITVFGTLKNSATVDTVWSPVLAAIFGYVVLAFLAFRSDAIAGSLASGSSNFGSGETAMAAAVGGAVGSALGASAAIGAVGGGVKNAASSAMGGAMGAAKNSMGGMMGALQQAMAGGGGVMQNAGPSGGGTGSGGIGTAPGVLPRDGGTGGGSGFAGAGSASMGGGGGEVMDGGSASGGAGMSNGEGGASTGSGGSSPANASGALSDGGGAMGNGSGQGGGSGAPAGREAANNAPIGNAPASLSNSGANANSRANDRPSSIFGEHGKKVFNHLLDGDTGGVNISAHPHGE